MATSHWPAFWHFAPGWGCIPVGIPTISSHGMILHSWPYSVTSWNITPFINSLPYSFIITCGLTTFFNWDNRDPTQRPTCSHPFGRPLLNFPPSTAKMLLEAIKAATLVFDGASVDSNVYRKCGEPSWFTRKTYWIWCVYIYIWYPPKDPPFLTYLYIIYIYIHIYILWTESESSTMLVRHGL